MEFLHWIALSLKFQVIKTSRRLFAPRLSCRGTQMRPLILEDGDDYQD